MEIKDLKTNIENKSVNTNLIIFECPDTDFVANQYINQICIDTKLQKQILEDDLNDKGEPIIYSILNSMISELTSIFGSPDFKSAIKYYKVNEFDFLDENLKQIDYLFIVCKKISKKARALFEENICTVPKLEKWQIKDYCYSICKGIDSKKLDFLFDTCPDMYSLDNELSKLSIFEENYRNIIFDQCEKDGIFSHLSNYKIFDFTDCFLKKDFNKLSKIYCQIKPANIDIEPLGVVTLLAKGFANVIKIQLGKNATAESTGMSDKQFWAVRTYNCGFYTKDQLLSIYKTILSVDKKLKTGILSNDEIIDYLIVNIFGA